MKSNQNIHSPRAGVIGAGFIDPVPVEAHVDGSCLPDWRFKDTDSNGRLLPMKGGRPRAVPDIGTPGMDTMSFILGAGDG